VQIGVAANGSSRIDLRGKKERLVELWLDKTFVDAMALFVFCGGGGKKTMEF